ncbi:unnamed protein product [Merluccius merluccius]
MWGHRVMDRRVEKVSLAFQDFRDRLEIEAPPDPLESLGLMAHQDQKLPMVSLENKETRDQQGTQDPKESQGPLGIGGETMYQVCEVFKACMAYRVSQGFQVLQELMEFKGAPDQLAGLDLQAHQGQQAKQGIQAAGGHPPLASCWSSTASLWRCRGAPRAAPSCGWATAWFTWRDRKKLTHRT